MIDSLYNKIKIFLKDQLPETYLNLIKKYHYLRVFNNYTEDKEVDLKIIKHIVKKGDRVIDAGANIGLFSKFLSNYVGLSGEVYCFEPIPITYYFLNNNIRQNKIKNIVTYNYALSNETGDKLMEIPEVTAGENYFRARISANPKGKNYRIKTRKLDELFTKDSDISFIKYDVEGHEYQAIKGSIELIREKKPDLLVEINGDIDNENTNANKLYKLLIAVDYSCWIEKDGKLILRQKSMQSVNYFFLTEKTIKTLWDLHLI